MAVSPIIHNCGIYEIDYSNAADGLIKCTVCGRKWTPTKYGWRPTPLTKRQPKRWSPEN